MANHSQIVSQQPFGLTMGSFSTNTSPMLEVEEAQAHIIAAIRPLGTESIALADATRRVLAQDIAAPISLPPFDNSAMDGYAVCAADVAKASAGSPCRLKRIGAVPAGGSFNGAIESGTCVRLFTGSPLPHGTDAVVMQEDTRAAGEFVEVLDTVRSWENVRLAGEDVKTGTVVARAGDRLTAARIALLGATGIDRFLVAKRPLVGILGTGNELIEAGQPLASGQIYESNRAALASLVTQSGGGARVFPLVRDTEEETRRALEIAFAECDAVVTAGGVSVGEHDCVKPAFESLGGTVEFWKVNVKPGKPFVLGKYGDKFLFGLPGNPVSAFVTFLLLVRPAILKMQGAAESRLAEHSAALAESFHNAGDRRHFMRVTVDARGEVRSAGAQASHVLSSLAGANALLDVPPKTLWPAGQRVQVLRWEL
jgi:molybdopterin molybdotransferase